MATVRKNLGIVLNSEFAKVFIETSLISLIFTVLWVPVYVTRCLLAKFIQIAKPSYGRILDHIDAMMEEPISYTEAPPKTTLAFTMVLNGYLDLKELRTLFIRNVLSAKVHNKKTGEDKLRYPEYKQYQVDFAGYKFWRNDETFNVDNHIIEESYSEKYSNLGKVHQEATNKLYRKKRSPWEIILVRRYKNDPEKTLLVYRSHHSMADTLSLLNVLVESLGGKLIKLPKARYPNESLFDKVMYYVMLPFYFVYIQVLWHFVSLKADEHPYKLKDLPDKEPLLRVGLSQKVSMTEIKEIARRNGVTASAVVMAALTGGIAKSDPKIARMGTPCDWILPKPNHPEKCCNHHYGGIVDLPTNLSNPTERLQRCEDIFRGLKNSNLQVYDKAVLFQNGTWFSPLRTKFVKGTVFPICLTNIGGDTEGFSIGGKEVEEMTMSCGTMPGSIGVLVVAFSYKDDMFISVSVKGDILSEGQTQKLAELMRNEFQVLRNI